MERTQVRVMSLKAGDVEETFKICDAVNRS
jgi:hypothetical protein